VVLRMRVGVRQMRAYMCMEYIQCKLFVLALYECGITFFCVTVCFSILGTGRSVALCLSLVIRQVFSLPLCIDRIVMRPFRADGGEHASLLILFCPPTHCLAFCFVCPVFAALLFTCGFLLVGLPHTPFHVLYQVHTCGCGFGTGVLFKS